MQRMILGEPENDDGVLDNDAGVLGGEAAVLLSVTPTPSLVKN